MSIGFVLNFYLIYKRTQRIKIYIYIVHTFGFKYISLIKNYVHFDRFLRNYTTVLRLNIEYLISASLFRITRTLCVQLS